MAIIMHVGREGGVGKDSFY